MIVLRARPAANALRTLGGRRTSFGPLDRRCSARTYDGSARVPTTTVIANQRARWCGNPFPLQHVPIRTVPKEKRIATSHGFLAMTGGGRTLAR